MCLSFLIFAFAEMFFSARYYEYISSFAPPGREALYMGLAIAPRNSRVLLRLMVVLPV